MLAEQAAARGFRFATIIHPTARVPASCGVGEGVIVGAGVVVGSRARLGRHVFLNRGALVGHHTVIHDYVSVMPGANIAGFCTLDEAAYVAIGAVIVDRISIGAGSVVGQEQWSSTMSPRTCRSSASRPEWSRRRSRRGEGRVTR